MKRFSPTIFNRCQYDVECPYCKHQAVVKDGIFSCDHCFRIESKQDKRRYISRASLPCPFCDTRIENELAALGKPLKNMIVRCHSCGTEMETRATNIPYFIQADIKADKKDPLFGYALWYQTMAKGHSFWAYNREHLNEIEAFVEADLRHDNRTYYTRSITAWLPKFIILAKNRTHIQKAIKRMRQRYVYE